jgi:hypothetical protein
VLQEELGRRLDVVIPSEPAQRAAWSQQVFAPLTALTASELLAAGVDLRDPRGAGQPLSAAQQDRLRDHFHKLARAFRAGTTSR